MTELRFETMKVRGTDLGEESCVPDLLGEHILQNHLERFIWMKMMRSLRDMDAEKCLCHIDSTMVIRVS